MAGSDFLCCTLVTFRSGGYPGGHRAHAGILELGSRILKKQEGGGIIDSYLFRCGEAVAFLITHREEAETALIADGVIGPCREYLLKKKLVVAAEPISYSQCSLSFNERDREDILILLADLPSPDLYNLHLFRMFGDPFSTPRLVLDETLREGFCFETDENGGAGAYALPEDTYRLLASIRNPAGCRVTGVTTRNREAAASVTLPADAGSAGLLLRAGGIFPTIGECIEPFTIPYMVRSTNGERGMMPLIPTPLCDAQGTRSGGPPRIVCIGFSLAEGRLTGPADLFDDPALDTIRKTGSELAGYAAAHGPFAPFL